MPDVVIFGLPADLRVVPPAPASPEDPDRDRKRQAWKDWRDRIVAYRQLRRLECENDPEEQDIEIGKCRASTAYFLTVWGHLFEPRKRKRSAGYGGEFILFAKQVELLDAMQECLTTQDEGPLSDLVVPKSRDVGASWCMCGQAVKEWLFDDNIQIRLISYKEELVESKKSGSLFWKIDFLIDHLPQWMKPRIDNVHLILTNLDNGNIIGGEATTKRSGRGDRATWIGYDEAAFFDEFAEVWIGSTAAADSRIAISSIAMDHGPDFYNLSMNDEYPVGDRPRRLAIDWWDHPLHDDLWLENERKRYRLNEAGFYREVLRNPFMGNESLVYPEAQGVVPSAEYQYNPMFPQYTVIDPGKADDFAVVFIQEDTGTGLIHILDSYSNSQKPADYYGTILSGVPQSGEWDYDSEALRIMAFTRDRMRATTFGDVAGWNEEAATMDSVYNRLANHKIYVIRDRLPDGECAASKRVARSFKGRREAMREIWPRIRCSNTPGARRWLEALRANRYKPGDRATQAEDRVPLHDWTSHLTSATEYFATHRKLGVLVAQAHLSKKERPNRLVMTRNRDTIARWEARQAQRNAAW
jgi:hypothetical protein